MKKTLANLRRSVPVGLLAVLAATAVAAFAVQEYLPAYLLARDAQETATHVAALQGETVFAVTLEKVERGVLALGLFDAGLNVVAVDGAMNMANAEALARQAAFVDAAKTSLSTGSIGQLPLRAPDRPDEVVTRMLVPLTQTNARLLVVDIDQTHLAGVLERSLRAAMILLLAVAAGFAVLPVLLGLRRAAERRATDEHIRFLALHDPLTGLPNRVQLKEHLGHALARAKRRHSQVGVLALDLDRFKEVNDTLGHAAGDALLISIADRLRASLRDTDLVARLGGDEFAIVIEDPAALNDIASLARRICGELAKPHEVNGHDFCTSTSIGIAVGPLDGASTDTLLRNADLALYRTKAHGRNAFTFFEPAMDNALRERSLLENDLRVALADDQLSLAYQPQFNLKSGALCGYEALLRWQHPSRGAISPDVFIPLAEESGLIHIISEWVLDTACSHATTWPAATRLAVNLSPSQFKTGDIAASIAHVLSKSGLAANRLDLEIPETLLFDNREDTLARLRKLRQMGVTVTIDDFGTGFSSLSHLSRFPFDKIKIDRSFVAGLRKDGPKSAIIDAIIGIGESLGVAIAAEGIETQYQADALREAGCTQVQGYLYGEPADSTVSRQTAMRLAGEIKRTSSAA